MPALLRTVTVAKKLAKVQRIIIASAAVQLLSSTLRPRDHCIGHLKNRHIAIPRAYVPYFSIFPVECIPHLIVIAVISECHKRTTPKQFLADLSFTVLPLTESIGHRALIYIEEYGISSGLRAGDALIAATAVENNFSLASGNARHFRALHDLALKVFKP